jgi:hypothetical protein
MTRGSGNLERKIHMRLAKFWTRGEWFSIPLRSDEIAELLEELSTSRSLERIMDLAPWRCVCSPSIRDTRSHQMDGCADPASIDEGNG